MDKIDLRLLMTLEALSADTLDDAQFEEEGVSLGEDGSPQLSVMVQHTGPASALEAAGLTIQSRLGDVVSGRISHSALNGLAELDAVVRIEGDYPMDFELDVSLPEINADDVNQAPGIGTPPQTYTGQGVIIGIIDSGIDFTHQAFRNGNNSRIISIWDQNGAPNNGNTAPTGFTGGVEYNRAALNTALGGGTPVPHLDQGSGHGTHVASIAGGNPPQFQGIAVNAEFIVVATGGTALQLKAAVQYIYDAAEALGRPCVINMSLGSNFGPHDGTTLLERAIDQALGTSGRAFVKSAGNSTTSAAQPGAGKPPIHWGASIPGGGQVDVQFDVLGPTPFSGELEIYYPTGNNVSVTLINPANESTGPHAPPATGDSNHVHPFPTGGTNSRISMRTNMAENGMNRIIVNLSLGVSQGTWTVRLQNTGSNAVAFNSWLVRTAGRKIGFRGSPNPDTHTITTPGTAREIIAVGSYITKPAGSAGPIASTSGRGPTADGRIKPDIAAPGQDITAARSQNSTKPAEGPGGIYRTTGGTSMAAPHVTGSIACLFERYPTLTQEQIRSGLTATARQDAHTGTGNAVPNNTFGAGKLDTRALLEHTFASASSLTWATIRTQLYNWTESDTPPTFEIFASTNGRAIVELAFGSQDIPNAPARTAAAPLRYYHTGEKLENVTITNADGSTRTLNIDEQDIRLTGNRATWTMPQELWDAYREELAKSRLSPPQSQMRAMLYYRVRFEPMGGTSALLWPSDDSFNASPLNNRMNIIASSQAPNTQVAPDQAAIQAMPRHANEVDWLWRNLPADDPDRESLEAIFSHRFFTNHIETEIRGKILSLWALAGPARQRLFTMLDRQFVTDTGLQMTVLKQRCIKDNIMLIDHLLELVDIVPHPDIAGVRVAEQMVDDVLREILDPNGQVNQGAADNCAPTAIQTLLITENAAEYARLMRGWLSVGQSATLANNEVVTPPVAIFRAARYAGPHSMALFVRTNAELAFQAAMLKYARDNQFPNYDPDAPPNSPRGINTVFQATLRGGLTFPQIKRALDGIFNANFEQIIESAPSDALRNRFIADLQADARSLLTVLHWGQPPSAPDTGLHAVLSTRHEASRTFFKNPQYAGSSPPANMQTNGTATNPPRRTDDPSQALESMGDDDLSNWVRGYYKRA